jgi:predicted PurR-regulated permease PerM
MMNNSRLIRIALTLAIVALLIVIIERLWSFGQTISGAVSTLAAAWFLAFLVKPYVNYLRNGIVPAPAIERARGRWGDMAARRLRLIRLPTVVAVIMVYAVVLFIVVGLATIATVSIIPQAADLIRRFPAFAEQLPQLVNDSWPDLARRFGFDPSALMQSISLGEIRVQATQIAGMAAGQLFNVAAVTAGIVGNFFLVIVLSLFIVLEDRLIIKQFFMVLPKRAHQPARAMLSAVDQAFSGYLRAQVVGAVLRGAFTFIVFSAFGVNFGVVVAIAFALLSFIPLIGGPIGIAIAALVTLLVRPEAWLPVALLLFAFDQLVAYVVSPRLMRHMVGVPSLIALLAISVGVQLVGFWGLIFGVPLVGAAYALVFDFYLPRRRRAEGAIAVDPAVEQVTQPAAEKSPPAPVDLKRDEPKSPSLKGSN